MANTIILRGDRSVRLPYRMLGNALATLQARLPQDNPARRLSDPWLDHIEERLGYVNLDEALLEDREGVRRLREELNRVADELERGEMPFPPWVQQITGHSDAEAEVTLDTCRRLVVFLDEVVADQEMEDAGLKPPPPTPEERRGQELEEARRRGPNPNVVHIDVANPTEEQRADLRRVWELARERQRR